MPSSSTTTYDKVPYPSYVHAQTQPDRLATMATLFGMQPASVTQCRVLELACAQGGNLIPLAGCFPQSEFVGVDLSARQVAKGQAVIDAVGLRNIQLQHLSIMDLPHDAGTFDFIIAHGVFSWVPADVRDRILEICKLHLAPSGVAFVSYNTFPGWHQRRMIRDMMRYHSRGIEDPAKRVEQAKAFLSFMTQAIPDGSAYGKTMREEFQSLSGANESYVFHEQLEEINEPQYFHEFAEQAARHDLQYLSEVELSNLQFQRFPPAVAETLKNMEIIQREQYLDFMMRRTFRQTLLCHDTVKLARELTPEKVMKLYVASPARSDAAEADLRNDKVVEFQAPKGVSASIGHAITKAAFAHLAEIWPRNASFDELQTAARQKVVPDAVVVQDASDYERDTATLATHLLHSFVAGIVELHTIASPFVTDVSAAPCADPLARFQAKNGTRLTTRRHQSIELDRLTCHLVTHLDGQTERPALLGQMVRFVQEQDIVMQHQGRRVTATNDIRELIQDKLEPNLEKLAKCALLVG